MTHDLIAGHSSGFHIYHNTRKDVESPPAQLLATIPRSSSIMPLIDYLAKNYLTSATKPTKKRKRKGAESEGIIIAEDDTEDWAKPEDNANDDDDDSPTVVGTITAGLNVPKKKTKWITVGSTVPSNAEQQAADKILADAQAEADARAQEDEEAPAIVGDDDNQYDGATMANGAMVGLQTAAQVTAALKRREKAERKKMQETGLDPTGIAQETIYRDASGRVINVAAKRAELRAEAEEKERKAAEELESRKGDVQRREKEDRRQALRDAKGMTVARHADDAELNNELKERERWNDPMAQLMASKDAAKGKGGRKSGRATYQGAFEPNRYGIKPGWRWDGVDRSNGFERKWFAARNKAKDRQALEYAWQLDE
ncbi:hypothetical protein AMS68_000797 [Peltaster fructicola]|uniref:Pre-mRNA-splicing factor CWC26 n=1 Tax=Peltaster fructicola TaxID=286661 RepID=A0A6H0XLA3_9PEZI|nr:hypothetical protein AMS68_000797 [Peltaster fructicola]